MTASSSGLTPSSGGMKGKTAAPSGTSSSALPAISASCHRGNDAQLIAILHRRGQAVEVTDILIVQIDVDEAADLAIVEETLADPWISFVQILERGLHAAAAHFDDGQPLSML